jgi:membrane associated rhomboid family serine protease
VPSEVRIFGVRDAARLYKGKSESPDQKVNAVEMRWIAWAWGFSLVIVWVLVALKLDQPLLQEQLRQDLLGFGAVQAELLEAEPWRLVTAQWLQNHPWRLLFTALMIAVIGGAVAERTSVGVMFFIGIGGGAVGLYVAAVGLPDGWFDTVPGLAVLGNQTVGFPENVRFGAAQSLMALSGAAIIIFVWTQPIWWIALAGGIGSFCFDLFQGTQGAAQLGGAFGFSVAALLLATGGVKSGGKRRTVSRRT